MSLETGNDMRLDSGEAQVCFELAPVGLCKCACDGRLTVLQVNSRFEEMTGYTYAEIRERFGGSLLAMIYPDDRSVAAGEVRCRLGAEEGFQIEHRLRRWEGSILWLLTTGSTVLLDGGSKLCLCAVTDVTRFHVDRELLEHLRMRAERDALTGLYDKVSICEQVEARLFGARGRRCALMIDLDGFKRLNDRYGHPFGDQVLAQFTTALKKALREGDLVGGDEFIVLLQDIPSNAAAVKWARELLAAVGGIRFFCGERVGISCSIGIAAYPEHGTDYARLYTNADRALYRAKHSGKARCALYFPSPAR